MYGNSRQKDRLRQFKTVTVDSTLVTEEWIRKMKKVENDRGNWGGKEEERNDDEGVKWKGG